MRSVTVRNKGAEKRELKEGAKGTTVELDAGGSHGCKVPEDGLAISGAGSVEIEAGADPLVLQVLGEDGDVLSEQPIAPGATVTVTGAHELLVIVDPAFLAAEEKAAEEAKEALEKAKADAAAAAPVVKKAGG